MNFFKSVKAYGLRIFIVLMMFHSAMYAQAQVNTFSTATWWSPTSTFSPVVHKDNTVTFRVKAPLAKNVSLRFGEWDIKPQPLTKDTSGVWNITTGPLVPGIYSYNFSIDGTTVPDMMNPVVKAGTQLYSSIVEIPGNPPRFDEIQNIPHGALEIRRYFSTSLKRLRNVYIYLPAAYFMNPEERFPVLYLRHGGGDNESSWTQHAGRADIILLDNLLAAHKAKPMIVVMTNGMTDGSWAGGSTPEALTVLREELIKDVIPMIDKNYHTKKDRKDRAVTGLSMGGGQSFIIGLRSIDKFAWVGEFSAGLLSDKDFNIDAQLPGIINKDLNKKLNLLWLGCGKDDPRYAGHLALKSLLDKRGINNTFYAVPGGHEWKVWRLELAAFMQKIFQ